MIPVERGGVKILNDPCSPVQQRERERKRWRQEERKKEREERREKKKITLGVLEIGAPEGANLVLTSHIPHGEADVLVLNSLDVET